MRAFLFFTFFLFYTGVCFCEEAPNLVTAMQNTYRACVSIDDNLHKIKVLAGINTAVTGIGTGLGIGATVVGFEKQKTDKEIEEMERYFAELDNAAKKQTAPLTKINISSDKIHTMFADQDSDNKNSDELEKLNKKSKNLGNWRTGLLAGNTATNITGAIISSQTINKNDIQVQINACISATEKLNDAIIAAKMNGEDVSEAQNIYKECHEYKYVDIAAINKRGTGALVSASIGAGLGGIGTVTSGIANSDKIRNGDTEADKQKEKDINTASNVLSIGATAASATATVFNATQIAAIKKVVNVSEKCTRVLK